VQCSRVGFPVGASSMVGRGEPGTDFLFKFDGRAARPRKRTITYTWYARGDSGFLGDDIVI